MSEIKQVTDWIDAAKQEPSVRNVANYLAYTMSELAECLRLVENRQILHLSSYLEQVSIEIRKGVYDKKIEEAERTELLDGAADTAWTAIGLMHMLGDAQGAFNEVIRSNWSKGENGTLQLDATGKVLKGSNYTPPDLAKFIR
jgi:predicted HAD superfamily Cof-like phosphohydrolase